MKKSIYYGNLAQVEGVEAYRLEDGRGDGVRMYRVRTQTGLEVEICRDRCMDITRLIFKGDNMGYFSPCGHVAPTYYDAREAEMVRSFTGGFLTTCGIDNVGGDCEVEGVKYPLHGRISNQPARHSYWTEDEEAFYLYGVMEQKALFLEKIELQRMIRISKKDNSISVEDTVINCGEQTIPCMILYHMNMGYPLLSEKAIIDIPSQKISPRNDFAKENISNWNEITKPGTLSEEVCYFHEFKKEGYAKIFNPTIKKGVEITFDAEKLPCFTQWKMMGKYDYVLGLEPGNCYPNGRKDGLEKGELVLLEEQEKVNYKIKIQLVEEEKC